MGGWDDLEGVTEDRGEPAAAEKPAPRALLDGGAPDGLSVDSIQKELQDLKAARHTADERISLFSQRGRGRGRGGRGPPFDRSFPRGGEEAEPAGPDPIRPSLRDRLGPRPAGEDGDSFSRRADRRSGPPPHERYDPAAPLEPLPGSNQGRLASAIVADPVEQGQEPEARQRPADKSTPAIKQRNKRLFGALLGTLQQFREEDQRFKRSRVAQQRQEAEARAEAAAAAQQQRLREQRREDLARARLEEINRRRELDVKVQAKQHELAVAQRIARELSLGGWLKTAARPPLLWLPRLHTQDTQLLLEQRATDLDAWRDAQLARLEAETAAIQSRFRPLEPRPRKGPPGRQRGAEAEPADDEPMDADAEAPPDRYEPEPTGAEPAAAGEEGGDAAMEDGEEAGEGQAADETTGS